MPKMIQIRNVPDEIHAELRVRAIRARMSLSDYLLTELEELTALPSAEEMWERLESRSRVLGGESSADVVRAMRDAR